MFQILRARAENDSAKDSFHIQALRQLIARAQRKRVGNLLFDDINETRPPFPSQGFDGKTELERKAILPEEKQEEH
ncbi:hypothetical protein NC651_009760 [Populus alba x Populus x berolinensis]|nr:hypothetical protein NC651_009760 [Populus alba x Populus x berolinensis]